MKTLLIRAIAAGLLVVGGAGSAGGQSVQAAPSGASVDSNKINTYIRSEIERERIPGVALGIVQGDQIVDLQGFGKADDSGRAVTPQTPFIIGSTSKSFTALAVMQLVEAGKIELDAPVQRYLPWFQVADKNASAEITVRQLLNQTTGLSTRTGNSFYGTESLEQAVRDLRTAALVSQPGATFNYSNANYIVLGLLIETLSLESYGDYVQQQIFNPLEMSHSYTSQDEAMRNGMATGYRYWFGIPFAFDATYFTEALPAGFLISTAEDMSHYLSMYINGGSYHGRRLLSASGIAEMQRPAVPFGDSGFYGMAWITSKFGGVQAIWHDGTVPNFHTDMVLVPDGNWGIVVLKNVNSANPAITSQISELARNVVRLVAGNQQTTSSTIGAIYLVFDSAVVVVLAVQIWSLGRLVRRRSVVEFPVRGLRHGLDQGRKWVLPLAWEVGAPIAILLLVPIMAGEPWDVALLFAPDVTFALGAAAALFLVTALVRICSGGLSLRSQQRFQPEFAVRTTADPTPRR